ncbi:DUF885 domain-containing protein [Mobilicoccus pelagius]|uniref:DUF885 domain-containing protein n=1 Tax=Mobilicoccus pelagius NBRC 104925 TaxID=1089455 RepID=H5UN29_9MICO|nr:DUF885 domain-containing protein [Mobilicoccus pelagius]GAB47137.1 hypothetical protein MOPEL_003_01630 [Mobilicoccus pelagius NBRC 104925]
MTRNFTDIDRLSESYTADYLRLSPLTAIGMGVPVDGPPIDDFSPEGLAALSELRRSTLASLDRLTPVDDVDAVTVDALRERLTTEEAKHDARLDAVSLDVIASPVQTIRDTLDLMPTATEADWLAMADYLAAVPTALEQWHASLLDAADHGLVAARRQIEGCVEQIEDLVSPAGSFTRLVREAADATSPETARAVAQAADEATRGYTEARERLVTDLLPRARTRDACGRDLYPLYSREFLGTDIDIDETYAWGLAEVERIGEEMSTLAERIRPGASMTEVYAALDTDPRYLVEGTDALKRWMQEKADDAISALADTHFDIPEPVRRIECCIAPSTTGGIYYTGPSEDFTRPGRMWWSVPKGVTTFGTWRELTTVYHEGVPGHHLQIGQTAARADLLNRWRRLVCWVSGHGEGWALYAERLMDELGYLSDDADRLGMLDAQMLRAARVVVDLGVHCELEAPEEVGGGIWDADKAWTYLRSHVSLEDSMLRFELARYLGWPGQAPSYKIGERMWLQLRDEVARAQGADFSLTDFHRRALDLGSVGLDTLRRALVAGD